MTITEIQQRHDADKIEGRACEGWKTSEIEEQFNWVN